MKKIFTLLSAALLGGLFASAQVTIGETNYTTLADAASAAAAGDVIMINEDITINNRVSFDKVDNVTLKAADGVTVYCRVKNKLAFLVKKPTTFENLNLVYNDDTSSQALVECSSGSGKLTVNNCTVTDFSTTSGQGVICAKGSGQVYLNGFAVNTTTVPEGKGEVFIGSNGSTLSGNSTASLFIEKNLKVTANSDFAPDQVVNIYVDAERSEGSTIVEGTENASLFHLVSTIYKLKGSNGNLITADINDVPAATIGAVEYDSFDAAMAAVQEGETIVVNKDLSFTSRVGFDKDFAYTIEGAGEGVTFSSNISNNKSLSFLVHTEVTLRNINFVWTGGENAQSFLECSTAAGKLTLENCTFSGINTTSGQGAICVKNRGVATLNNVAFANNTVPEGRGEIFIGNSGSTLSGNTNGSIYVEGSLSFNGAEFAPAAPVKLYLADNRTFGTDVVLGTTNLSYFDLQGTQFSLDVNGDNIIAVENTLSGVEEVEAAEAAAEAVYYNVNGVAVDAANLTPGLYIRLQGSKATKVLVK